MTARLARMTPAAYHADLDGPTLSQSAAHTTTKGRP
jgi:hypothetical protein